MIGSLLLPVPGVLDFGIGEWLIILVIILVLFGGRKIPSLARDLGLGIREFRKSMTGFGEEVATSARFEEEKAQEEEHVEPVKRLPAAKKTAKKKSARPAKAPAAKKSRRT